jgi:polyisoprenoid-binding protein YceI
MVIAVTLPAAAADFQLDKAHTQAEFVVTHLALSKVHGHVPLASGTLTVGPGNIPTAATATFDLAGIDSQNDRRDNDLRENYFEVAKYPTMTFVERKIDGTPKAFTMTGDLTMHGVTKSITLTGSLDGTATIRGKQQVAYSATGTIDRRDFGMSFGPALDGQLIVGYDVTINLEVVAVQP